jgi:uncharacterized protein (TIGR03437 family)
VEHWNTRTPIRFVERTSERNYVRFIKGERDCSSNVGMVGGAQSIRLGENCDAPAVIHEIGHAVGLFHEQSRQDRNFYISLKLENVDKRAESNFTQLLGPSSDIESYDFSSIMHYEMSAFSRNSKPVFQTIPPGIPVGEASELSEEDIAGVRRLYGVSAEGTTITAFPSGASIEVDGETFASPKTFNWAPGTQHTISAASQEGDGSVRYVFARWSDGGTRTHRITATRDVSVYTANYVREYRLPITASPSAGGTVIATPASVNGWYAEGTEVELRAVATGNYRFRQWTGFGEFGRHGVSPNPLTFVVNGEDLRYTANFTTAAITLITSSPPGRKITVDGDPVVAPRAYVWAAGTKHTVAVAETMQKDNPDTARYKFQGWSDGGETSHEITAEADSTSISAQFQPQYLVVSSASGGTVTVTPSPVEEQFYEAGTVLQVVPTPSGQNRFVGWTGDLQGADLPGYLLVEDQKSVRALFAPAGQLTSGSTVSAASFEGGDTVAPGQIITIFGLNIGPESASGLVLNGSGRLETNLAGAQVLINNTPAPLVYAGRDQVSAIVPYSVAGRGSTSLRVVSNGVSSNTRSLNVVDAAPAIFTADSSGRGGAAALNEDGSVNTASNPAIAGSVVVLYATGEGTTSPAGIDGRPAQGAIPKPVLRVRVRFAGQEADVLYAGGAPGLVAGVLQVNARLPESLAPGRVPVVLQVGERSSLAIVNVFVR